MSRSEQKEAVLSGSKKVYVVTTLLPLLALNSKGTIAMTQSCALSPIWPHVLRETIRLFSGVSCCVSSDLISLFG